MRNKKKNFIFFFYFVPLFFVFCFFLFISNFHRSYNIFLPHWSLSLSSTFSFLYFFFPVFSFLPVVRARPFTRQRPFGGRGHGHSGAPQILLFFLPFRLILPPPFSRCNLPRVKDCVASRKEEEKYNIYGISIKAFFWKGKRTSDDSCASNSRLTHTPPMDKLKFT